MSGTGTLALLRHGESVLNAEGYFTGMLDPPLTAHGRREAEYAALSLVDAGILPTKIFTSTLLRATATAAIASRKFGLDGPPARLWQLNERNYGSLTGRPRAELSREFGADTLYLWRRTLCGTPPPMEQEALERLRASPAFRGVPAGAIVASESLCAVSKRVDVVWLHLLRPRLLRGETVLCVGHGNSLRALCFLLDGLSEPELEALNIPTGQPLVYRFDRSGLPLLRGGRYINPLAARTAADKVAVDGGT